MVRIFFFLILLFTSQMIHAACTSPAGVTGEFEFISPNYFYCDGTNWQSMAASDTGISCSVSGVMTLSGSDLRYCNGTNWISMNGGTTGTTCAGTTTGTLTWDSGDGRFEYCNGTNWIQAGTPDPCSGKAIGAACNGTVALYAGVFDGGKYMIMQSGCADDTTDPTCTDGTDTVTKTWNSGTTNYYDIPGVTNISAGTSSSSSERGHYTTPIIAAITLAGEGGQHAAARYCDQMDYGGYDDWYLPSSSELAYVYCISTPGGSHSTSYPQENANCGGSGPTNELTGFATTAYWSSTEGSGGTGDNYACRLNFNSGGQSCSKKEDARYVRCVRRY